MAHITHKKLALFTTIWNTLTFEGNPTKVNCWFCNQDAYLLPGSKQTPSNWYCDLCKNINARDQSGDIIDLSLQYSYNQPDTSHCFRIQPRQSPRSLCEKCTENEEKILKLVSEYIPDEDDPTFKYRYKTSDEYVESLHAKYPICEDCQIKIDALVEEQKEAERSRNFISRITNSLTTKPPKRPSRLFYFIQGLFWIWAHLIAIATLLYGYYYISRFSYTPPSWVQADSIFNSLDNIIKELQSPTWNIEKVQYVSIQTIQHIARFLYNTYLLAYKVALRTIESKKEFDVVDWELEDYALEFYIANIISWAIIDWHPIAIKSFVEEPGRVRNWQAYKMIQRFLYLARIGNLVLINHVIERSWVLVALGCYATFLLVSVLMVRAPKKKCVMKTPSFKPLGGAMKRTYYGVYLTFVEKLQSFKESIKPKKKQQQQENKKKKQQQQQNTEYDIYAMSEDQNESEEEVERVATKIDSIRL